MTRVLVFLLALNLLALPVIQAQTSSDTRLEKARQEAGKLSGGRKKATVKMKTGEKYKGRITAVSQDSFTFVKSDGGTSETISFADVDSIKKSGGIGTGSWIAIGALAAVGTIVAIYFRQRICNEQVC